MCVFVCVSAIHALSDHVVCRRCLARVCVLFSRFSHPPLGVHWEAVSVEELLQDARGCIACDLPSLAACEAPTGRHTGLEEVESYLTYK